jgi:hypothetical protein
MWSKKKEESDEAKTYNSGDLLVVRQPSGLSFALVFRVVL